MLKKRLLPLSLLSLLLLSTGCVYLRLMDVKKQLAAFSENITMSYEQAVTFIFNEPVLFSEDMVWLMRSDATTRKGDDDDANRWIFWLEKQYSGAETEEGDFDIRLGTVFEDDKLKELWLPLRFREMMDEAILLRVFENVKRSKVKEKDRSAAWNWYTGVPEFARREVFLRILGVPYVQEEDEEGVVIKYAYNIKNGTRTKEDGDFDWLWVFSFEKESSRMLTASLDIGRLHIHIDVEKGVKVRV